MASRPMSEQEANRIAFGAAGLALVAGAGALLWLHYGETLWLEQVIAALANCF